MQSSQKLGNLGLQRRFCSSWLMEEISQLTYPSDDFRILCIVHVITLKFTKTDVTANFSVGNMFQRRRPFLKRRLVQMARELIVSRLSVGYCKSLQVDQIVTQPLPRCDAGAECLAHPTIPV